MGCLQLTEPYFLSQLINSMHFYSECQQDFLRDLTADFMTHVREDKIKNSQDSFEEQQMREFQA